VLCNDPPERAVLGRSSGVQEVHYRPSKEDRDLPWNAVRISLDNEFGSLTSPPAGRTTAAHGRSSVDVVN